MPKGQAAETRYARAATPRLLSLLETYFGRAYPYPKLDSMVIPITVAFGAMENPGLITYRSGLLLSPPEREDAHEMAHQWFGDLVTMVWWNDLWLNESFATWMSRKIVQQFNPAWEVSLLRFVAQRHDDIARGMSDDAVARMPRWHVHLCTPGERTALQALYGARLAGVPGGPRNLAQTLEAVDICIAKGISSAAVLGLFQEAASRPSGAASRAPAISWAPIQAAKGRVHPDDGR